MRTSLKFHTINPTNLVGQAFFDQTRLSARPPLRARDVLAWTDMRAPRGSRDRASSRRGRRIRRRVVQGRRDRIPLTEEEVVVDKRAVVKEELVVGKCIVEEQETVQADVRREEFDIDRNVEIKSGEEFTRKRRLE